MNISILYEDNHLLFVEKPINFLVQEDQTGDPDLLNQLKNMIKIRDKKPGNVYLALVHRLDRPVGGVMVFAKTSKAASRLSDQIRRQAMKKTYLAVVYGTPYQPAAKLVNFVYKDQKKNYVYVVKGSHPKAKKAILDYKVLDTKRGHSLVAINLQTGRPHQIRVQLAQQGYPLYGDQKYGRHIAQKGQQLGLWAHQLEIEHPVKKEPIKVISNPPREYPWNQWGGKFY